MSEKTYDDVDVAEAAFVNLFCYDESEDRIEMPIFCELVDESNL